MKDCDEKLKAALWEAMRLENAELEAEVERSEPHIFSEDYRQKLNRAMQTKGRKRRQYRFIKGH